MKVRGSSMWASALGVLCVLALAFVAIPAQPGDTVSSATDTTVITECTTIEEPGRYELSGDLWRVATQTSTPCIRITANDVIFDGGGHTYTGKGVSNTSAILVVNARNVTVQNVEVHDWHRAIHYHNVRGGEIRNVTVESSVYGIALSDASGVTVAGNTVSDNFVGIEIRQSGDNTIRDNVIDGNAVGVSGKRNGR